MKKWHGTPAGYIYHKCRCPRCRQAHNEFQKAQRQVRISSNLPLGVRHNRWTYSNWGCRCDQCKQDAARYREELKQREGGGRSTL